MKYYVVLNDGDTFSALKGCAVVGITEENTAADEAATQGDGQTLAALAEVNIPIEDLMKVLAASVGI